MFGKTMREQRPNGFRPDANGWQGGAGNCRWRAEEKGNFRKKYRKGENTFCRFSLAMR